MAKPPHIPTETTRAEVAALKSFGVPQHDIAAYIGLTQKTLTKWYKQELNQAKIKADLSVGKFLFQAASGQAMENGGTYSDSVRAAMFWAKTQMGWRETTEPTQSTDDKIEITITRATKPE